MRGRADTVTNFYKNMTKKILKKKTNKKKLGTSLMFENKKQVHHI